MSNKAENNAVLPLGGAAEGENNGKGKNCLGIKNRPARPLRGLLKHHTDLTSEGDLRNALRKIQKEGKPVQQDRTIPDPMWPKCQAYRASDITGVRRIKNHVCPALAKRQGGSLGAAK